MEINNDVFFYRANYDEILTRDRSKVENEKMMN